MYWGCTSIYRPLSYPFRSLSYYKQRPIKDKLYFFQFKLGQILAYVDLYFEREIGFMQKPKSLCISLLRELLGHSQSFCVQTILANKLLVINSIKPMGKINLSFISRALYPQIL